MQQISVEQLIRAGVGPTQARTFLEPLRNVVYERALDQPKRFAAFLSQCMHESTNFTHMEEDLYYRTPERIKQIFSGSVKTLEEAQALACNPKALANRVYANRNGNGNEASGDGWTFRGRGPFGLTGRKNYDRAGIELGQPFIARPELVALPDFGVLTAAWYWNDNNCSYMADNGKFNDITRAINGPGMAGAAEREALYERCLTVFA